MFCYRTLGALVMIIAVANVLPALSAPEDSIALPVRKSAAKKTASPALKQAGAESQPGPESNVSTERSARSASPSASRELIHSERFNAALVAQLVFDATNVERTKAGLAPFLLLSH